MSFTVDTKAFEDMERMIVSHAEFVPKVAPKVLKAGADVLVAAHKAELGRIAKGDRSIGTLRRSIGKGKIRALKGGDGISVRVSPQGSQKHGNSMRGKRDTVSNAQVGHFVEHGTSTQPARPWMSAANKKAEKDVTEAMQKTFTEEMEKM